MAGNFIFFPAPARGRGTTLHPKDEERPRVHGQLGQCCVGDLDPKEKKTTYTKSTTVSTSVYPSFHHTIQANCLLTNQSAGFYLLGFPPRSMPRVVTDRVASSSEDATLSTLILR